MFCQYCDEEIKPYEIIEANDGKMHHECFFRVATGSAGHHLKQCSCYGGIREDEPSWTKRENARESLRVFRLIEDQKIILREKIENPDVFDDDTITGYTPEDYPEICSGCDQPEDWCICNQDAY